LHYEGGGKGRKVNILPITIVTYELIYIPNSTAAYKEAFLLWVIEDHEKKDTSERYEPIQ
jgi:hypothetical protein